MKKTGILLALLLVVGIVVVAYAGAINIPLVLDKKNSGGDEENPAASGFVIVNQNPRKTIVEFQVRGLTPDEDYWAYYYSETDPGWYEIGELKMNKFGSGHVHKNMDRFDSGDYWFGVSAEGQDEMNGDSQVLIHGGWAAGSPVTL